MRLLMKRFIVVFFLLFVVLTISAATQYFVSTSGSDTNSGTIDHPFLTISNAVGIVVAGDTIYVRGGSYSFTGSSTAITLPAKARANPSSRCNLFAYPGERALLDFSAMTGTSADGLKINGSYWYIKGFDCKGAPHNGIKVSGGNYNVVEFCTSFESRNTGVQLASGASYNQFINCDSYNNRDVGDGNADGFSPKLDVGTNNYFYGCRSWQNSDDGWDGYLRPSDDVTDTLVNCWSFMNGYYKDGITMGTGNGNGFKTGGCDANADGYKILKHNMTLINCISFYNKAKGFDQNHNRGSVTMLNCTAFNNGNGSGASGDMYNYAFPETLATSAGKMLTVKNCISLGSISGVQLCPNPTPVVVSTNSWLTPFNGATNADFISIDTTGVRGPRKADGSLPDIAFMHLTSTSQFVDAGTDVGLPFLGRAPDLGCFESGYVTGVKDQNDASIPNVFTLYQNYPNPFNPSTTITYQVPYVGIQNFVSLQVYDILGRNVATLVNEVKPAGTYMAVWNASGMSSGMYFIRLSARSETGQPSLQTRKMLLTK